MIVMAAATAIRIGIGAATAKVVKIVTVIVIAKLAAVVLGTVTGTETRNVTVARAHRPGIP